MDFCIQGLPAPEYYGITGGLALGPDYIFNNECLTSCLPFDSYQSAHVVFNTVVNWTRSEQCLK